MGRPRDTTIDTAILLVAWQELERVGYSALTMTAVADGAGVQKPALYRRWATKPLMVIDTLAAHLPGLTEVDLGSLDADLEHLLGELAAAWSTPAARRTLSPLLADLGNDDVARAALSERLLAPRGLVLRQLLLRAAARGELAQDAPLDVVGDLLEGPLMHRVTLRGGEIDAVLLRSTLDGVLARLR